MSDTRAEPANALQPPLKTDYVRFIILSGARTGSHMLAAALNSSDSIICFREVYNHHLPIVQYGVDGYDEQSEADASLRQQNPQAFLRERIFSRHAQSVDAVGFKWHYRHIWGLPILDTLTSDQELRVIHLRRRNELRTLVSLRIAERSGSWLEGEEANPQRAQQSTGRWGALRQAVAGLLGGSRAPREGGSALGQKRLLLSEEECRAFFNEMAHNVGYFEERFAGHRLLTVFYEELLDDWTAVLDALQSFLGVEPRALAANTRQQNPEPLRDLIENYDELRNTFAGTPHAAFFE